MTEYKTGQKVRITKDETTHCHDVGTIVTLAENYGPYEPEAWKTMEENAYGWRPYVRAREIEPVEDTPAEETEKFTIDRWRNFKVGDLVTGFSEDDYPIVARSQSPKPQPGTTGSAIVKGRRIHGVIDSDGDFTYVVFDDYFQDAELRYTDPVDFIPDFKED